MKILLKEADKSKIKELEHSSAFTWEGMFLDRQNIDEIAEVFINAKVVKKETVLITGYIWSGRIMNDLYELHGDNKYSDDLPFLCFDNKTFNGAGNLDVFKLSVGARWLDDIVRNNAIKEANAQISD